MTHGQDAMDAMFHGQYPKENLEDAVLQLLDTCDTFEQLSSNKSKISSKYRTIKQKI